LDRNDVFVGRECRLWDWRRSDGLNPQGKSCNQQASQNGFYEYRVFETHGLIPRR
jgi:hypothetical protein